MPERSDFAHRAVHEWHDILPHLDATDDELVVLIRLSRLAALKEQLDELTLRQFEPEGIRGLDDFRTIALLRRVPAGLSNTELMEQIGGSKGGTSARLERFAVSGICLRTTSQFDRRSQTNTLTPRGIGLADRMVTTLVRDRKLLLAGLTPEQVSDVGTLLARMIASVSLDV